MDIANQKALHERPPYTQNIDFWAKQRNIAMKNYSAPTNLKDKQLWQIHTSSLTFAACLLLWMTTVKKTSWQDQNQGKSESNTCCGNSINNILPAWYYASMQRF